jgi:hypothetical protein
LELLRQDEGLAVAVFGFTEKQQEHQGFQFVSVLFLHFGHFINEVPVLHENFFILIDEKGDKVLEIIMFVFDEIELIFEFGFMVFSEGDHHVGLIGVFGVRGATATFDIVEFLSVS